MLEIANFTIIYYDFRACSKTTIY